jgi:NAD+ kinase
MVKIKTFINGQLLNVYWADGLIVATPTGSTGYSLSCGGPIIFPQSNNFVVTPIAPHNLNVRPVVLSDSSVISFEIEGRAEYFLSTLDSRYEKITTSHKIKIKKCDFKIRLVKPEGTTFMTTISSKLMWGLDMRN